MKNGQTVERAKSLEASSDACVVNGVLGIAMLEAILDLSQVAAAVGERASAQCSIADAAAATRRGQLHVQPAHKDAGPTIARERVLSR